MRSKRIPLEKPVVLEDLNQKEGNEKSVFRTTLKILCPTLEQFDVINKLSQEKLIAYSLEHFAQLSLSDIRKLKPKDIANVLKTTIGFIQNFNNALLEETRVSAPFIK